jgi:serine/threonine-protein kinase
MDRTVVDNSPPGSPEPDRPREPGRPPAAFQPRLVDDEPDGSPVERTQIDAAEFGSEEFVNGLLRRRCRALAADGHRQGGPIDDAEGPPPVDRPSPPRGFTHPRFRSDPPDCEPPAPVIPGYDMLGQIGSGGMGAVWKARQTSLDRLVAIKVLPPVFAANGKFIHRFRREAMATARLNNPNIIAAIDVGETHPQHGPPVHYFVMEFVDGESLEEIAQREHRLPSSRVVEIALAVARALDHAWTEAGIVHRDIKPANLLVSKTGVVKVADFGLARCMWESVNLTAAGLAIGTPHYASPEQARGEVAVDARTDIYAPGATMFRRLTGRTPFLGHDAASVMTRHANETAPAPHDVEPNISPELSAVVVRMMARAPDDRYQTLGELIADLERLRKGDRPLAYTRILVEKENSLPPEVFEGVPPPGARARRPRRRPTGQQRSAQWPGVLTALLFIAATGSGLWYAVENYTPKRMTFGPPVAGPGLAAMARSGPAVSFVTSNPGSMVFGGGSFPAALSEASTVQCMVTPKQPGYVYLVLLWADDAGRVRLRLLWPAGEAAPTFSNTLCRLPEDGGFYSLPESARLIAFLAASTATGANRSALLRGLHAAEQRLAADGVQIERRIPTGRTLWYNHHGPGWAIAEDRPATGPTAVALTAACERIADIFDGDAGLCGAALSCTERP